MRNTTEMKTSNKTDGISIIIPCHNSQSTIARCIGSIPIDSRIEVIVVDDNSNDNTIQILKKNRKQHNICIVRNANRQGAGGARNIGIKLANKKYLMFLDSDDTLADTFMDTIEKQIDLDYDVIIFDAQSIKNRKNTIKMFNSNHIHQGLIDTKTALVYIKGCTWGKIYKTKLIKEKEVMFPTLDRNEDLVFTKIAISESNKIYYLEKVLYNYIDNPQSLMHNKKLLNTNNAKNGYKLIKNRINNDIFKKELNSIYFIEVLYSVTKSNIRLKEKKSKIKEEQEILWKSYDTRDSYRSNYYLRYKIFYILSKLKMQTILKIILR